MRLLFIASTVFNPGFKLSPGQSISSGKFLINIAENPYKSLVDYASVFGIVNKGITNSIVNGWCNWFYTLDHFTDEEIIRNAEFASKNLKQYGLEYIQIDEGYQTLHGEWQVNSRFPHGLKWFCSEIKSLGLKPGIWISLFVVSETAEMIKIDFVAWSVLSAHHFWKEQFLGEIKDSIFISPNLMNGGQDRPNFMMILRIIQ